MNDEPPKRRGGRPPKYDWDDKRDICYKLYVEEQRSTPQIAQYFAEHFNVDRSELPCRKAFLRQFKVWGFPSHTRGLAPEEEAIIGARIQELWERNINQKDIKATLAEEGYQLRDYDFTKLWKKNGNRLRNDKGFKPPTSESKKRKRSFSATHAHGESLTPELGAGGEATPGADAGMDSEEEQDVSDDAQAQSIAAPLAPEAAALRAQRLAEIQAESDQKLTERKRRRRIRGYGHLPADAVGTAPRYNSETSLDECKAYLHLSNDMYQDIRKEFEAICRELAIVKKTLCADGVWAQSIDRLIQENLHLSAVMNPPQPDQEKKRLAMDVVCTDVTKRMRDASKSITIAQANNILGLNPAESKKVRRSMYELLAAENFESRILCGEERWQTIRHSWYDCNEKVQQAVTSNDLQLIKAVDLLCSDAMKRYREDRNKRGEREMVQKNRQYGPGPGPAWVGTAPRSKKGAADKSLRDDMVIGDNIHEPSMTYAVQGREYPPQDNGNLINTLVHATGNIDFDLDPALTAAAAGAFAGLQASTTATQPITAYFRLSPTSRLVGHHPRMWLGKLASASIESLHTAATCKTGIANVAKAYGLVKNDSGGEDSWLVETDDELQVYLSEAQEKATFLVALEGGYSAPHLQVCPSQPS